MRGLESSGGAPGAMPWQRSTSSANAITSPAVASGRLEPEELGSSQVRPLRLEPIESLAQARSASCDGCVAGSSAPPLDSRREIERRSTVDQTVEVQAEPESELEVALGNLRTCRSNRAACPWPTPTHSVAEP